MESTDPQKHALEQGVHPYVVGYLSTPQGKQTHVGPRTWQRVSDIIKNKPDVDLQALLTPMIGALDAIALVDFIHISEMLPDVDDVLTGKVMTVPAMTPGTAYALICTIAYALKDDHDSWVRIPTDHKHSKYHNQDGSVRPEYMAWIPKADHATRFVMDNMEPEMAILFARTAIQVFHLPFHMSKMPAFRDFAEKYRALVMA